MSFKSDFMQSQLVEPLAPLVSIIMPAFNAGRTIAESIDSVFEQFYSNWELIIIDDGSKDNTESVVTPYLGDQRLVFLRLAKNGGLSNARNEGIRAAKGEFIAFLDSDDLWLPEKLQLQVTLHLRNPKIKISHTDFNFYENGKIRKRMHNYFSDFFMRKSGNLFPNICYKNPLGILTVMINTKLLLDVGLFDTALYTFEDQDLFVRISSRGNKVGYISKPLAHYRISEGSLARKIGKYKWAYKKFIRKLLANYDIDQKLVWRFYYRFFGTVSYKKGNFKMSTLYFSKSLRLVPFGFVAGTTYLYWLLSQLKQLSKKTNH